MEDVMKEIDIVDINIDEAFNCRGKITRQSVFELMSSIEKQGLMQPIVVRTYPEDEEHNTGKTYDLIAGFRRMTATQMLGDIKIKALVKHQMSKDKARILNLQENLNRQQLTLWEEAESLQRLIGDLTGYTEEQLCEELTISRGYLQPRLMLCKMPTQVHELAHEGFLGCQGVRDLNKFSDNPEEFAKEVRRLREAAQNRKASGKAPKKLKIRTVKKDNRNPASISKSRTRKEMNAVVEHFVDCGFAGQLFVRSLAWAAGNISDLELLTEIKEFADEEGIPFVFDSSGLTDVINETI